MDILPAQEPQSDLSTPPPPPLPPQPVVWSELTVPGSKTHIQVTDNLDKRKIYLIEGVCDSVAKNYLKNLLPDMPEAFFEMHAVDTLSRIEEDIDDSCMLIAKWSRVANQDWAVWIREKRLRDGNPFNVNHHDPEASDLDHEKFVHTSKPYRPYDPILEYTERRLADSEVLRAGQGPRGTGNGHTVTDDLETQNRPRRRKTVAEPGFEDLLMIQHAVRVSVSMYHGVDSARHEIGKSVPWL